MKLLALGIAACILAWVMLLIGGTVNPTGSSLACPNWEFTWGFLPLCHGQVLPEMSGGVLYEHGHRLWGWLVGLSTVGVMIGAWATKGVPKSTRWLSVFAVFLVGVQGLLGGLTVKFGLDPIVSTGHLLLGYLFLSLMVFITWRLAPSRRSAPASGERLPRTLFIVATLLVLAQVALGGAMRHYGGGMICGTDAIGCGAMGLWPEIGLAQLHMSHRFLGYLVFGVVLWATHQAHRQATAADRPVAARLAFAPAAIVTLQVALGILTIATGKSVAVVTLHTAFGGLLVASMIALVLAFGPLGAPRGAAASGAGHPGRLEGAAA